MWPKQFKLGKVAAVVGSIVVVGVSTRYVLLHTMCDLKAAHMNVQSCLIRELVLYEFKLVHYTAERCCAKGEGTVD